MNADQLDSLTERVLGAVFEVTNTLGARQPFSAYFQRPPVASVNHFDSKPAGTMVWLLLVGNRKVPTSQNQIPVACVSRLAPSILASSASKKEFALLRALAAEPTRVFTREELLRGVWGFQSLGTTRTLDAHAARLRKKLAVGEGRFIVNVWGVGYRLIDGGVEP